MYDLNECLQECMLELDNLDIKYGNIEKIYTNSKFSTTLGYCKKTNDSNTFVIEIAPHLLNESLDKNVLKEIIIHELLHSCKNSYNHGKNWQELANKVNNAYPQYNIHSSIHIEEFDKYYVNKKFKYILVCNKCGIELKYDKICPKVRAAAFGQLKHIQDNGNFTFKDGYGLLD
jgi:predicted SprT family Zn-dependent metalloprotease